MTKLLLADAFICAVIAVILIVIKKLRPSGRMKTALLLIAPLLTIACHYSSIVYHIVKDGSAMAYLQTNPNLVLPIYPCNVVMWCCLIFGLCKNKTTRFAKFLADYIFWFGIFSAVVGMVVNVDFIRNPTFADYDVTKGIISHAFMLLNVLILPVLGYIKIDLPKNFLHIIISMIMMFVVGCYCNLLIELLASKDYAVMVNSMFILQSPFEGVPFLRYPLICGAAAVIYFIIFNICELFAYNAGNRWWSRFFRKNKV